MRFLSRKSVVVAGMFAGALALAGCGGGSTSTDDMDTDDSMPTAPAEPTALQNAVDAQSDADAALAEAKRLLMGADAASKKLTADKVNGSSQMAYDNAMTVLAAEAAIQAEYNKADAALTKAKGAEMAAAEGDKARIGTIVTAVMEARDDIKEIQDAMGDDSLAEAIKRVRTGRPINETPAKMAQVKADAVASAVDTVIGAVITAGSIADPAASGAPDGTIMTTPNSGMTFKQIAGGDSKAAMMLGDFTSDNTGATVLTALGGATARGGATGSDAFYMGIPGDLFCMSATCSADGDGKITGNLQFFPDDAAALYAQVSYGAPYTPLTNAAMYGHWLDMDTSGAEPVLRLNLYKNSLTTVELDWDQNEGSKTSADEIEATYSGMAGGFSERMVGTGDNEQQSSGQFTANVKLDATFGASETTLAGTINGFAGGAHVNPAWHVTLGSGTRTVNAFAGTVTNGSAHGKQFATGGVWTAAAYGAASATAAENKHASGFVGTFAASFEDGSAAGSYHASK